MGKDTEEAIGGLDEDWSGLEGNVVGGNRLELFELWETSLKVILAELWTCCGLIVTELFNHASTAALVRLDEEALGDDFGKVW